jgi:hypothetical protein
LAINPPSDIVLDVARAADPLKLQAAALKLTGATDTDEEAGFSSMVDGLGSPAHSGPAVISEPGLIGLESNFGPKGSQFDFAAKGTQLDRAAALSGPAMKPYRDFEAFVLQSFIQSMLPNDTESVFGRGTAGEMWKGLLAEQLGKQFARSGGIGIAGAVLKAHPGMGRGNGFAGRLGGPPAPQAALPPTHPISVPLRAQMAGLLPSNIGPPSGGGSISKRTP